MFAVIKTGGKQYKIQEGEILQIEKLNIDKGKNVKFDEVLLIEDGDQTQIGTPFVKNAVVEAVVIENFKDKKVIVFKKKRRKQYRKTKGHRQELTKVQIERIVFTKKQAPKKAAPKKKDAVIKTLKPAEKALAVKTPTKKKVVTKIKKTTPVKE